MVIESYSYFLFISRSLILLGRIFIVQDREGREPEVAKKVGRPNCYSFYDPEYLDTCKIYLYVVFGVLDRAARSLNSFRILSRTLPEALTSRDRACKSSRRVGYSPLEGSLSGSNMDSSELFLLEIKIVYYSGLS
jgi:hypothetical protein